MRTLLCAPTMLLLLQLRFGDIKNETLNLMLQIIKLYISLMCMTTENNSPVFNIVSKNKLVLSFLFLSIEFWTEGNVDWG
jgi:hypothetical protein